MTHGLAAQRTGNGKEVTTDSRNKRGTFTKERVTQRNRGSFKAAQLMVMSPGVKLRPLTDNVTSVMFTVDKPVKGATWQTSLM